MDPIIALLLGLLLGVAVGVLIGVLVTRARATAAREARGVVEARHQAALADLRTQEASLRAELSSELARVQATAAGLREQVAAQQDQYREFVTRTEIERREREEHAKAESKVLQALTPVQETLRTMQAKVTELETQRSQQHGELSQQLKTAAESEERLRATAEQLASALRNNATRGVWGETQLRTLVESAGLLNRVDFTTQASITSESGARRPDMVLNLPGGKSIAVDSKVPYNAYIESAAIPAAAGPEQEARRRDLLAQHAKQVKNHVDALSAKTYWSGLESSPEFTIAFIPNESLLSTALDADPTLLEYAFGKRIALASPVSFWAVLKTVAFTWQQDVLTEDAKRLFDLSRELYGRLATLAEHAEKLRRSIDATVTSYNNFASSLESRVLVTARKLDALDESKVLGEPKVVEDRPKQLSAVELVDELLDREEDTVSEGGAERED
ncbi:DNA recombination protein RmuC [uncultured Schumannella sp.]|uniref:DNA recombination protein RmuC n=1 Tax=uncultured Schumannella sp. TaxID=1195956 RepID=UPI0025FD4C56|nr:DNA recombination protein RmuC [uncultured Schumannella sp.]